MKLSRLIEAALMACVLTICLVALAIADGNGKKEGFSRTEVAGYVYLPNGRLAKDLKNCVVRLTWYSVNQHDDDWPTETVTGLHDGKFSVELQNLDDSCLIEVFATASGLGRSQLAEIGADDTTRKLRLRLGK